MPTITTQQLVNMIQERRGTTIITFTSTTEVRLRASNPFGKVFKNSIVNGVINYSYENSVNKQREREGIETPFVAEARAWGQRIPGTPFVRHNDKIYLTVKVESTKPPTYVSENGVELTSDDLSQYFYNRSSGSGRQGVENAIIHRDYTLENVTSVTLAGEVYQVVHRGNITVDEG